MMRVESKCTCTLYVAHSNESSGMIEWTWIDRWTITERSKIAGTDTIDRSIDRSHRLERSSSSCIRPRMHRSQPWPTDEAATWCFYFPSASRSFFSFHFETIKDVRRGGRTRAHATPHWIIYKDRGWTLTMDAFSTGLPHNIRALNSNNRILLFPDVLFDRHHATEARMRAHIPSVSINSFFIREGTCLPISRWWNLPPRYHLSVIIYLSDFVNLGCSCESICSSYTCAEAFITRRCQEIRLFAYIGIFF